MCFDKKENRYTFVSLVGCSVEMKDIESLTLDEQRVRARIEILPLEKLGDMFANCLLRFNSKDPKFGSEARFRLRWICYEWKRRQHYLPPGTDRDRPDPGMLKCLGYRVGSKGKNQLVRRLIIDYVMQHNLLPPIKDNIYMDEWSLALTAKRFYKFERVLSQFIDFFDGSGLHARALRDWSADFDYLNFRWGHLSGIPQY